MNSTHRAFLMKLIFVILLSIMVGCSSTPKVKRIEVDKTVDISGRWNDTDSRMVAQAVIDDCLRSTWQSDHMRSHGGRKPDVIVGTVVNRSHEHINVQTFVKDLERALIRSGRINFVASREEREEVRQEREDMAVHASDETQKGPGQESGADYMLKGTINTIIDEAGGKKVVYYQVNLDLLDMSNNRKVWIGEKKIKKIVSRPKLKW